MEVMGRTVFLLLFYEIDHCTAFRLGSTRHYLSSSLIIFARAVAAYSDRHKAILQLQTPDHHRLSGEKQQLNEVQQTHNIALVLLYLTTGWDRTLPGPACMALPHHSQALSPLFRHPKALCWSKAE